MPVIPFPVEIRKQQCARRAAAKLAELMRRSDDLLAAMGAAHRAAIEIDGAYFPPEVLEAAAQLADSLAMASHPICAATASLEEIVDAGLRNAGRG